MAQKPIAMELLKQILPLQNDGIPIRELTRRTGFSHNCIFFNSICATSAPLIIKIT